MYEYSCIVNRVVDGDTVDVDIDLGFGVWLKGQRVRLSGINAPETRTKDLEEKARGFKAKKFVEERLPTGSSQLLVSEKIGKYGRIIGTFIIGGVTLSSIMLVEGHAVPYT